VRREFPNDVKRAAYEASKDDDGRPRCAICKCIIVGRPDYDHIIPDALGGEPILSNCACTCPKCHRLKTATEDVPRIAEAKREYDKHAGIRPRGRKIPSRPFNQVRW
jgi:5-methylcytosine-specific restriction protein A